MTSHNCDCDQNTCSWGGCFDCDSKKRVFTNFMTGKIVTAQFRKGDIDGTTVYRLGDDIHACFDVDEAGEPECAYINELAASMIV